jgi:hypothetical protein
MTNVYIHCFAKQNMLGLIEEKYSIIIILVLVAATLVLSANVKAAPNAFAQSQAAICPPKNVQHWDKIVFLIRSSDLARRVNLPVDSELDIKVLDDPLKVADIKQKVLTFMNVPDEPRDSIQILFVDYAMICA